MAEPSTQWQEVVAADEAERHRTFADRLVAIQESVDRTAGPGRVLHRKQVLGLSAELEVLGGLPEHARQGLFARPGRYRGFARMSNGGIRARPDAVPDIRGLALSFRGVRGRGALGGQTDRQDFVLINRSNFGFEDSRPFVALVLGTASGAPALAKTLVGTLARAPIEAVTVTRDLLRPFSGFATEPFFSAAPIQWGRFAARVCLDPHDHDRHLTAARDFTADMADRLTAGPVTFDLRAQFFVSEDVTPIEDGRVDWPEEVAPYVTVGRVTLPKQDPSSPAGRELAQQIERDRFDPWAALAEHRPLGEIMRARKVAYLPSQQHRGATGG